MTILVYRLPTIDFPFKALPNGLIVIESCELVGPPVRKPVRTLPDLAGKVVEEP